ncbi:MAG: hypothetical protein EXR99_07715 [Gemmataceae bacterium]|nr:hypothetical protein [Gemmataceae bacterium]
MKVKVGITLLLFVFVGMAHAADISWQAGLAREIITPKTQVWLAGYGSKRAPEAILHDLWMKALALKAPDGTTAILITSDFQGVPKSMSDRVFAKAEKQFNLKRSQIMITFSHNHCGPRLGDDLVDYYPVEAEQVKLVEEYTSLMVEKMVELIGGALADLKPAKLEQSEGRAAFAVNRRNNKEAEVPAILARGEPLKGPVDHTVPVLKVTRPDGSIAAILFGYACHPTTLSFTKWCGDYPGYAQIAIEKKYPGACAMFVNTCGGDQNPLPRRQVELCEKYGRLLAEGVFGAMAGPFKSIQPGLKLSFAIVPLPYEKVMTEADLQGQLKEPNAIKQRWAKRLLDQLETGAKFQPAYPYPLHVWKLGQDTRMIGMGAETVVDYALRFKAAFGKGTWVLGYTDDMIAYIPSRRVWAEGGYEGGSNLFEYGRPALRWSGQVEEIIARQIAAMVKGLD